MTFENIYDAKRWFLDYKELDEQTIKSIIDFHKYETKNWKFGDWILFQHIENDKRIGRPQYAIFTNFTIWDQSLVMQFVENKRAWMNFTDIVMNKENGYKMSMIILDDEVEKIVLWDDNIHVLGHWKSKPNLSELKSALKNTIKPLKEAREDKLTNILK